MSDFSLPIFPFDSSALTVTTTVWIGVMVGVFFNLRFGWTLSGLVVPGYLTPLLMTRPLSVAVILVESVLVYWIVLACSEGPRRLRYWSSFFGRDRFFFILLISVIIRALLDGFLLPMAGEAIVTTYGLEFDYKNDLHSFGLIIVALIANYFWKPGLLRGLPPLAICVGVTYASVVWVLVPYTNFSIGNLYLLYEDITSSLLASPKAYILVITTAYLASWMNLRYAWDFNGILIPALLGLLWYEPSKILVSGFECVLVLLIGQWLLKFSLFQKINIEGARKLGFFFSVCFLYRLVLCHFLPAIWPTVQITDAFGYGYLLTTLMAVKIHDKKRPIAMLIGTVHVSLAGAVAGSLIGFALLCSPRMDLLAAMKPLRQNPSISEIQLEESDEQLMNQVRADRVLLYEKRRPESYRIPTPLELSRFRKALITLKEAIELPAESSDAGPATGVPSLETIARQGDSEKRRLLSDALRELAGLNYRVTSLQDRFLYLRENSPTAGWGIYVIDTLAATSIGVQVPAPLGEWATVDCGVRAMRLIDARSLAIAGARRKTNLDGSSDVLRVRDTMMGVFQQVFASDDLLQIRGFTQTGYRRIAAVEGIDPNETQDLRELKSRMYVHRGIPDEASLALFRKAASPFDIRWNVSPFANTLRDRSEGRVLEWFLSRADRRQLVGSVGFFGAESPLASGETQSLDSAKATRRQIIRVPLRSYMQTVKASIMPRGSELYRPPTVDEMLFMGQEVITPLLELASSDSMIAEGDSPDLNASAWSEVTAIDAAASGLGYRIDVVCDPYTRDMMLVLVEEDAPSRRGWGTYVFRLGLADSVAIEIPRPMLERYAVEFGINLFEHPRGSVLSLAGSHPHANHDRSADISLTRNRTSLFNLVRHELLRYLNDRPFLIVQARAITAPVQADIVVACEDGSKTIRQLSPLKRLVMEQLTTDDLTVALVGGQSDTAGYEIGMLLQATTTQTEQNKEAISLWLSPSLRRRFVDESASDAFAGRFEACGIRSVHSDLAGEVLRECSEQSQSDDLPVEFVQQLMRFVRSHDVVQLHELVAAYPDIRLRRIVDDLSGQSFLWIRASDDSAPNILNLNGAIAERVVVEPKVDGNRIRHFARCKYRWLKFGGKKASIPLMPGVEP